MEKHFYLFLKILGINYKIFIMMNTSFSCPKDFKFKFFIRCKSYEFWMNSKVSLESFKVSSYGPLVSKTDLSIFKKFICKMKSGIAEI